MNYYKDVFEALVRGIGPYFIVDEIPLVWTKAETDAHIERVTEHCASSLAWCASSEQELASILGELRAVERSPLTRSKLLRHMGAIGNHDWLDTPEGTVAVSRICGAIADRMENKVLADAEQ